MRGLFLAALLCLPLAAAAQPREDKVWRIAHLHGSSAAASKAFVASFREGMRALGYIEPRHYVLEERYADGKNDRLPALAQELVARNPDLLLASTTPGSLAAKAATQRIPVVFVLVADPLGAGLVPSLARPGGNVTGITNIVAELAGKRVELLRQIVPAAERIAVLVNQRNPNTPSQMKSAEGAARGLRIELQPVINIGVPADLEPAFEAAVRGRASAAIRMIDPLVFMLRKETAALATKHRLPVIYPAREDVEAGGLMSYGANVPDQYRQAAGLVDRILRGAKPADLPVEQPTKFDFVINLRTAKALNLIIPPALLVQAEVIH